ncbi:hypothetical protein QTP86_024365 [Hemibagrus guttatus]|nr:hypothetical protein QTP86_024365 [Hemibagrus guttatus]
MNTKAKEQRCISPNIYQAEYLEECWNRINKDGKRATVKMADCGNPRNTTKETQNATTAQQP